MKMCHGVLNTALTWCLGRRIRSRTPARACRRSTHPFHQSLRRQKVLWFCRGRTRAYRRCPQTCRVENNQAEINQITGSLHESHKVIFYVNEVAFVVHTAFTPQVQCWRSIHVIKYLQSLVHCEGTKIGSDSDVSVPTWPDGLCEGPLVKQHDTQSLNGGLVCSL